MSQPVSYTRTAIALHWLMFLLIAGAVTVGWTMADMDFSPTKLRLVNYHKWIGVTILLLAALRILWRLTHKAPPFVPMPRWQSIASHSVHGLLYLLMLAVPIAGYLYSNAAGFPIVWFGKIPLPTLLGKNAALSGFFQETHEVLATTLVVLAAVHILAGLKHHYVDKDETLVRMAPHLRR